MVGGAGSIVGHSIPQSAKVKRGYVAESSCEEEAWLKRLRLPSQWLDQCKQTEIIPTNLEKMCQFISGKKILHVQLVRK